MGDLVQEQKERERRLRETTIAYGAFTLQKTVWWSLIELDGVIRRMHFPRGGRVLDAGCSDGRFTARLRELGRGDLFCVGTDFALNPLKVMRAQVADVEAVCADAARPLFKDGVFDAAVLISVLQHLASRDERLRLLKNIFGAVRPGGMFGLTVINRPSWATLVANGLEGPLLSSPDLYVYLYDPSTLKADLEAAGFLVREVVAVNNLPVRYLRCLGPLAVPLDMFITKCFGSLSRQKGRYLLAVCDRP